MSSDDTRQAEPGVPLDAERTEAFVQLLAQHRQELYRFVFTILPNKSDADDVLQQTSVILWRKFHQFDPNSDFVRWACRVAHFEVRDFRKRQARDRHKFWTDELVDQLVDIRLSDWDVLEDRRCALRQCVEQLPPGDRRILEGRYSPEMTIKALSENLGQPANTLYKSLNRIRRSLIACVERALART